MPNYDKHRAASALLYTTALPLTDQRTAGPGWKRELVFYRELGVWMPGEVHTYPHVFGVIQITFHMGQN